MSDFEIENKEDILRMKEGIRLKLNTALNDPIFEPSIAKFIIQNCVVSGGISASVYHNETINDVDVYLKSNEQLVAFNKLKDLMGKRFLNVVKDVNKNYSSTNTTVNGKVITSNAITFYNDIQVVTLIDATSIPSTFDFLHCRPVYDISEDKYYISPAQLASIKQKALVRNLPMQTTQIWRVDKFLQRGWVLSKS